MRRALLVASLTLCACGSKPPPPARTSAAPLGAPRVAPGELDARALLSTLPTRAQKLGAGPVALVAAGEALEGERLGGFVEVRPELCLVAYARASTSVEDLDLAVFSDEGAPLALDEAPDPHPSVVVCPPHPARVYVSAHVATGDGLVAIGAQLLPPDRAAAVAKELGAHGSAQPRPESLPGLNEAVRAHLAALGGAWDEVKRVVVGVDARMPTMYPFVIDANQCVDVVVLAGEEIALLDVDAVDVEGRVLGRAHEGGSIRTLTMCAQQPVNGSIAIRPHVGTGPAALVLSRGRGDLARDLTARPDVAWTGGAQPLRAAKEARNAELKAHGYDAAPIAEADAALTIGRRASVAIERKGAKEPCVRVDVVAGAPLALVDASAWDDAGALVSQGEGAASVTLFVCTRAPSRVDVETRGRPGPFAALVRPEPWSDPAFSAYPLAAARMLARAAQGPTMLLEGTALAARATPLDAAHAVIWTRTVAAGRCLRVSAGAQGEGAGLDLRLFDGPEELDRSHAADAVSARVCAGREPRTIKIELRATSGKLDAVIGERG